MINKRMDLDNSHIKYIEMHAAYGLSLLNTEITC